MIWQQATDKAVTCALVPCAQASQDPSTEFHSRLPGLVFDDELELEHEHESTRMRMIERERECMQSMGGPSRRCSTMLVWSLGVNYELPVILPARVSAGWG